MTTTVNRLTAALADRYTIERELGVGGMATVYLAHDIKHNRKVAVKVLKPELSAVIGGERFVQEIEVTANLQHPNILPLYDSGTAKAPDGEGTFLYYVMPLIEGESLRDRLDRERQLPVEESVQIAKAVAAALDYAHRHEVVHRDIKPGNILLHDGQALVADFGIALAVSAAGGQRMTETGMSIGTPHYMSPEQASADRELDGRTDVYSLGATLYEMLAGQPPFIGASAQAIVARILTEQPPAISKERESVPPHVEASIATALAKLPADRFQSASDFAAALSNTTFVTAAAGAPSTRARSARPWLVPSVSGVAIVLLVAAVWGWFRPQPKAVLRLAVAFADGEQIQRVPTRRFQISPDGTRIAYLGPGTDDGPRQIWIRRLDQLHARPLAGTELAQSPFFSPDGQFVAFVDGQPGALKVVPVDGGPVQVAAADSANPWGGSWGEDGWLYFSFGAGVLARVRPEGGPIDRIAAPDNADGEVGSEYDYPVLLPGGKALLLQVWRSSLANATLATMSLETGEVRTLVDAVFGKYLPTGHLVYVTFDGSLFARPFDVRSLEFTGPAVGVEATVRVESFAGVGQFDISDNGYLVYQPGGASGRDRIVRVDRGGAPSAIDPDWQESFENVALSPDGTRLAVVIAGSEGSQVWVKELDTGPAQLLTFEGRANGRPKWTPDGRAVMFTREDQSLGVVRADGGAPIEPVFTGMTVWEALWSRDGTWLVFRSGGTGTGTRDIRAIRPGVDSVARVIVGSPADEYGPALSPDGRWLAYVSNETGREEVFVRPFPDAEQVKYRVTVTGGSEPRWSHSGRELFLRNSRGEMVVHAVRIDTGTFRPGPAEALFDASEYLSDSYHVMYDITPDDQQFIMIDEATAGGGDLVLVVNWFEVLQAKFQQ